MFRRFIDTQLERVRKCPQAGMLGEKVYEKLEDSLKRLAEMITGSTSAQMIARAADNSFAASLPALLTKEEKSKALDKLRLSLTAGQYSCRSPSFKSSNCSWRIKPMPFLRQSPAWRMIAARSAAP